MTCEIAIFKVPAPTTTLQQFVNPGGVSQRAAYRYSTGGIPCTPAKPRVTRNGNSDAGGRSVAIIRAEKKRGLIKRRGIHVFR